MQWRVMATTSRLDRHHSSKTVHNRLVCAKEGRHSAGRHCPGMAPHNLQGSKYAAETHVGGKRTVQKSRWWTGLGGKNLDWRTCVSKGPWPPTPGILMRCNDHQKGGGAKQKVQRKGMTRMGGVSAGLRRQQGAGKTKHISLWKRDGLTEPKTRPERAAGKCLSAG